MSKVAEAMETYKIILGELSVETATSLLEEEGFVVIDSTNERVLDNGSLELAVIVVNGLIDPSTIFVDISVVHPNADDELIYFW